VDCIPNDYEDAMANMADEYVQLIYKRVLKLEPVIVDDKNRPKVLKTIWAKFDI
jgi:hypothetical protein